MPSFKFRVLLDSVKEQEIFRDIVVNDDTTFEEFYTTIISSFDFSNDQMASFFVSNEDWDKGDEITLMDMSFGDDEHSTMIMSQERIGSFIETDEQRFLLVYDFLNMWICLIELQEIFSERVAQPHVVLKVGDIPEDLRSKGPESLEDLQFDSIQLDDDDDYGLDDFDDEFSSEDFDNIDDYDL